MRDANHRTASRLVGVAALLALPLGDAASVEEAREANEMVLEMVGEFAAEEVAPAAEEVDRQGARLVDGEVVYADAMKKQLDKLAELGLSLSAEAGSPARVQLLRPAAATLLLVGGATALTALQAMAVSTGFPFTIVLLAMCVSLLIGLRQTQKEN